MQSIFQYHETAAVLIARIFLGCLFLFQGYDAMFKVKVENIIATYKSSFQRKGIPSFIITSGAWFTSLVELLGGLLLIVGFYKYAVLYLLGLDLILASIAFGIGNAMWDMRYVFPRLALLLFLLIAPVGWDTYTLDNLLFKP